HGERDAGRRPGQAQGHGCGRRPRPRHGGGRPAHRSDEPACCPWPWSLGRGDALCGGVQPRAGVPVQAGLAHRGGLLRRSAGVHVDANPAREVAPAALMAFRPDDTLFSAVAGTQPLAARMRPRTLDEYAGQQHILGPGKPLREAIERGTPGSIILWGPPGSGKTTLASVIAGTTGRVFVPFSAVTEGVPRIREI